MSATLSTILRPMVSKRASPRILAPYRDEIARHFVHRAAIARLRELDDEALRDIGLAYSEIEAAVHGRMTASNRART